MKHDLRKIVWLASYPKSGNTWTRVFLANYLSDCAAPILVNALDMAPIATSRLTFDECVGVSASRLPAHIVARLRPEVYRQQAREADDLLFIKVHDAWRRTDLGTSMFPADVTAAAIYLIRNPLDVALSLAHHTGRSPADAAARMTERRPAASRDSRQLPQDSGLWGEHVQSWVDDSGLPVTVIRYEDLRVDPYREFSRLVEAVGLPFDAEQMRRAIEFSRLEELQRQEQAYGFRERPLASTAPFFRRGGVNRGRRELDSGLVERLTSVHGETMQRFGYLDEVG